MTTLQVSKTSWSRNDRKLMRNESSVLKCLQTFLDFACIVRCSRHRMCSVVATTQDHRSIFVGTGSLLTAVVIYSSYKDLNELPFITAGQNIHDSITDLFIYIRLVNIKQGKKRSLE